MKWPAVYQKLYLGYLDKVNNDETERGGNRVADPWDTIAKSAIFGHPLRTFTPRAPADNPID